MYEKILLNLVFVKRPTQQILIPLTYPCRDGIYAVSTFLYFNLSYTDNPLAHSYRYKGLPLLGVGLQGHILLPQ